MTTTATISDDPQKNVLIRVYLVILGAIGLALIGAGFALGWGFYAYFGGGLLAFAGIGGLAGMKSQGGFGNAPCPSCGAKLEFQFTKQARTMECPSCGAWSEGAETMKLVPNDRVAEHAVFTAPLPKGALRWPGDGHAACALCFGRSSRTIEIEGSDAIGATAAMVSPVSVRRIHKLQVPACDAHDNGAALFVQGSAVTIAFRSRAYHQEFRRLNG